MDKTKDLMERLQNQVNSVNTMLIETELEGDVVNQNWYKYENCKVLIYEDSVIFYFIIGGKKSGSFITKTEYIQKNVIQEENTETKEKHLYLFIKGKQLEPLLSDGMFKVFHNKVTLPDDDFNLIDLYNSNRQSTYAEEKWFLDECFKNGLFRIHKFQINDPGIKNTLDSWERRMETAGLSEYSREDERTLHALYNLIRVIQNKGYEIKIKEKIATNNDFPAVLARAFVSDWNLIISPDTQNITTILNTFAQKDKKVCIVSSEGYREKDIQITAYLIERKNKFYESYAHFLERKRENQYRMMEKVWEHIDSFVKKEK